MCGLQTTASCCLRIVEINGVWAPFPLPHAAGSLAPPSTARWNISSTCASDWTNTASEVNLTRRRPAEPIAHLILGRVMESVLLIAHSDTPEQRRIGVGEALDDLLRGLE